LLNNPPDRIVKERDLDRNGVSDRVVEKSQRKFFGPYVYETMEPVNQYGLVIDNEKIFIPEKDYLEFFHKYKP
jgi:hypothetical protein